MAISFGLLLTFGGLICVGAAVFDLRVRYDPHAISVTAHVDQVVQDCSAHAGCHWTSYGTYEVAGRVETNVEIALGRDTPARGPQDILVDPAHPRDVVNQHETKDAYEGLGLGIALLACTALLFRYRKRLNLPENPSTAPEPGPPRVRTWTFPRR